MIEDLGSPAEIDFSEVGERGHGSAMRFLRRWTRVWAIAFVAWTVLAFLSAAGAHVYTASMGSPESWAQLLAWNITISFVWSLLTPPIYALARRFTFERGNWPRMLPAAYSGQRGVHLDRRLRDRVARALRHLDSARARSLCGSHAVARADGFAALLVHPPYHPGDRLLRQISPAGIALVAARSSAGPCSVGNAENSA